MREKPTSYCEAVKDLEPANVHRFYHDTVYGFPISDDNGLFERLILEINQAGLSWTTILNKQQNFNEAFDHFAIAKVAAYGERDRQRLLDNAGIVRNRLKIEAAIYNAGVVLTLQKDFGSFKNWLDAHRPFSKVEWTKLFKNTFRFTGGEIVNEFLVSTGYLAGAHVATCPVYHKILRQQPV